MMMIEIAALANGAHRNQTFNGVLPEGWAVIPEGIETENFPFGEVVIEEVVHYREKMVEQEVTKTREVETFEEVSKTREVETIDEAGNPITTTEVYFEQVPVITEEEYTEIERVVVQEPYTVMTVTEWIPGAMSEPDPEVEPQPTAMEQLRADVDYIAIMTGVEL